LAVRYINNSGNIPNIHTDHLCPYSLAGKQRVQPAENVPTATSTPITFLALRSFCFSENILYVKLTKKISNSLS